MSMKKRMICLSVAGLLAASAPAPMFGQSTSQSLYNDLLSKYEELLKGDNKAETVAAFYQMYSTLKELNFKAEIEKEIGNLTDNEKKRLAKFGFGDTDAEIAASVHEIYDGFLKEFPTLEDTMDDSDKNKTVFEVIYEMGSISEEDYDDLFPMLDDMGRRVYDYFPKAFRDEIYGWVKDKEDVDQLDVFSGMYNVLANEKIATEKTYRHSNKSLNYIKVNLGVGVTSSKTEENMKKAIDEYVSEDASEEIVSTFVKVMNAILESVESELGLAKISKANVDEGLDNTKYATLKTLQNMKLIEKLPDYTKPRDTNNSGGGSSSGSGGGGGGGNGGGGNNTPSTGNQPNNDNNTIEVNEEDVPQGPADTTKKYESEKLESAMKLKGSLANESAEKAAKSIKTLTLDLAKELNERNANGYEAAQVANTVVALVEELLEKPDLTSDEAQSVVKSVIETTLKNAVARDIEGANTAVMNKKAVAMVEAVIKKAGQAKADSNEVVLSADSVKDALAGATKAMTELKATLVENGMTQAAALIKPVISIELTATNELQEVELAAETLESLKASSAEVEINLGGMKFKVPAELLAQYAESGMTVESDILEADETQAIKEAEATDGLDIDVVSDVYDIEFKAGNADANLSGAKPKLSIDVKKLVDMLKVDAHKLSVFVYDDEAGAWEHVPTKIVDGVAEFEAPHFSKYAVLKSNVVFDDIQGHWAQETIEMMTANKITSGRSATAFEPDAEITRAEFAAYLVNMIGLDGEVAGNFKDIPEDAWYYKQVGLAGINGLVSGVGNGNFAPDATVTRQDMAVMIAKAYKFMNGTEMKGNATAFGDSVLIADYAYDAVSASKYHSIIGGFEDGSFRPSKTATRAEAAQMLRNLFEK
ncbi:S-layer homology domain-containing protein [Fusibacter sp. JL216-2]|uniref:S-layer homology domain-containing protein n=1 Tax=Fusibacter sp. JL216-2 TaxID=3071453 RepID=UPI003D339A09